MFSKNFILNCHLPDWFMSVMMSRKFPSFLLNTNKGTMLSFPFPISFYMNIPFHMCNCFILSERYDCSQGLSSNRREFSPLDLVIFNTSSIVPFHSSVTWLKWELLGTSTAYHLTLNNDSSPSSIFIPCSLLYFKKLLFHVPCFSTCSWKNVLLLEAQWLLFHSKSCPLFSDLDFY